MTPKQRRLLLLGLLAASTALVALGEKADKPQPVGAVAAASDRAAAIGARGRASASATSDGQDGMIREIRPRAATAEVGKAFATRDWTPPPPPPKATEAPAAAPTAPPLSFTFLGKEWQEGHWLVFLGQNNKTYIVKEGDAIDSNYRVDAIHPPQMTLTYLPLEQQQTLTIGDNP